MKDLKQQLEKYTDFNGMDTIPETVIEAFTKKIIVSDKGFDWYLRFRKMDKPLEEKLGKRKSKDDYSMVFSFTLTIEDAKAYVYQFSKKRRVLSWRDITVNLWI